MEKQVTTYSMWRSFRDCRQACAYRYIDGFVPLERNGNLAFGSLIHRCLEVWHKTRSHNEVYLLIAKEYSDRFGNERRTADWHLARAMMHGYMDLYQEETFAVIELEKKFDVPIFNPATFSESRSFLMSGKVDGIVQLGSDYWLLEHKTASVIDGAYIDRLWTDFQILLYAHYIEQYMDIRIVGVIYNILGKAKLRQSAGETELEYELRRSDLIAKSKTGKTTAKRKMPETDEDFQRRLAAKYKEPGMFHREHILIDKSRTEELKGEIWELTQAMLDARRRGVWYKNTSQCFNFGRPCDYYPICRSGGNPLVIENNYEKIEPHEELR